MRSGGASQEQLAVMQQRLALLEQQMGGLESEVHQIGEAQAFQSKLLEPAD
jgi:hypothetical protein